MEFNDVASVDFPLKPLNAGCGTFGGGVLSVVLVC